MLFPEYLFPSESRFSYQSIVYTYTYKSFQIFYAIYKIGERVFYTGEPAFAYAVSAGTCLSRGGKIQRGRGAFEWRVFQVTRLILSFLPGYRGRYDHVAGKRMVYRLRAALLCAAAERSGVKIGILRTNFVRSGAQRS